MAGFKKMKISIIGAGNGGQTFAGFLSMAGYETSLYDKDFEKINLLKKLGGVQLEGKLHGFGRIDCITTDIAEAVKGAKIIMVTTVANAHQSVAQSIAPYLENNQIVVL